MPRTKSQRERVRRGKTDHTVWCLTQERTVPKSHPNALSSRQNQVASGQTSVRSSTPGKTSDDKISESGKSAIVLRSKNGNIAI